jgi:hypothetical protein
MLLAPTIVTGISPRMSRLPYAFCKKAVQGLGRIAPESASGHTEICGGRQDLRQTDHQLKLGKV